MKLSTAFIRNFFLFVSTIVVAAFAITVLPAGGYLTNLAIGLMTGLGVGLLLIAGGRLVQRYNLRIFNIAAVGLLFGYLMGAAINLLINSAATLAGSPGQPELWAMVNVVVLLASVYFSMLLTAKAAEEITISVPFVRFNPTVQKKRDILIDASVLADTRLLDLVGSGLFDNYLVLPRYVLKELQAEVEAEGETSKGKARRALDIVKKLEAMPNVGLRFSDTDLPEVKDPMLRLVRLARLLDANILTADINRLQQSEIEGVRVINIHSLANALKPVTQTGEFLEIKVQRYGKEPRQGVGYLEDGTMVVINGGAEYIGETIKARVLSVKHTTSGRMVFCNAAEEDLEQSQVSFQPEGENSATRKYFSVEERR